MKINILKFIRLFAIWFVLVSLTATCTAREISDTINQQLLSGIHTCFAGDYDTAWNIFDQVREIDAGHPSREYYQAIVLFWKNNIDHNNPRYDRQIRKLLRSSLEKSEKLLEKNENNIDALHYAGLAYTYLGRMDAHRGSLYDGGLKGETGRKYLEKAISLCEKKAGRENAAITDQSCDVCEDIYFPLGAYTYFAGKLPKLLRFVNFLWFIPKGSAEEGLKQLARTLDNGCLHQLGTQSLLINIYAVFETHRLFDASILSEELVRQFPDNPYLDLEHARILLKTGRFNAAHGHAKIILKKVSSEMRNYDQVAELGAWLVMVESELSRQNIRQAEKYLQKFRNNPAYQDNTLSARIFLVQGQIADLRKNRKQATAAYRKVIAAKDHLCDRETRKKAELYLDKPFTGFALPISHKIGA